MALWVSTSYALISQSLKFLWKFEVECYPPKHPCATAGFSVWMADSVNLSVMDSDEQASDLGAQMPSGVTGEMLKILLRKKCTLCNSFIIVALLTYNSRSYIKEIGIWSIQHEKEEILQSSLSRSFSLKFILCQNSLGENNWCFSISLWYFCSSENSY